MTISSTDAAVAPSATAQPAASKRTGRRHRLPEVIKPREDGELKGWPKAMERLLGAAVRGEIGTVVGRWQATSLTELRDALDAAIATAAEAGHEAVIAGPLEVVLAHYPQASGGSYKVRFHPPVQSVDDA